MREAARRPEVTWSIQLYAHLIRRLWSTAPRPRRRRGRTSIVPKPRRARGPSTTACASLDRAISSVPSRLCDKSPFLRSEAPYPSTTPFPRRWRLEVDVATPPRAGPRPPQNRGVLHGYDRPPRGPARQTSGSSTSTPSRRAVRRPEHQATRRTRSSPRPLTHSRTTAAHATTSATTKALRQLAPAASRRRPLVPSTLSRRTIFSSSSSRRHARDRPERPTSSASRTTVDHN